MFSPDRAGVALAGGVARRADRFEIVGEYNVEGVIEEDVRLLGRRRCDPPEGARCAGDRAYEQLRSRVHVQIAFPVDAGGGLARTRIRHDPYLRRAALKIPAVAVRALALDADDPP